MPDIEKDIATVSGTVSVPNILDVICRSTGMGFAAVARVTEDRWVACSVLDQIRFGVKPGDELVVGTTICREVREERKEVVINDVDADPVYCLHDTPKRYGFKSYVSVPIVLPDGEFFGTLCAIDPKPAQVDAPEITGMFRLFAELIAFHYHAAGKLADTESSLHREREISGLREEFIAVLGHDLRTPLGAISSGAAVLQATDLPEPAAKVGEMIARSAARMSGLIDDVLDFARGRLGGGIPLEADEEIHLQPFLHQVVREAEALWPDREIIVRFDVGRPVRCDPRRIAQLFTNLLANAVSHGTPEKPVTVTAGSGQAMFELSVSNHAEPIPPEILQRLFHPFSRGGPGGGKGLGLGLYIASQIAKAHGGKLVASSTEEITSFTFSMGSVPPPAR